MEGIVAIMIIDFHAHYPQQEDFCGKTYRSASRGGN